MTAAPIPEKLLPYRSQPHRGGIVVYDRPLQVAAPTQSSFWRPELAVPSALRPFTVSPYAVVRDINKFVDLSDTRERHVALDHPDTGVHDDAVAVKKLAPSLYEITISVPAAGYQASLDLDHLPTRFSARAKSNLSLSSGIRKVFSIRALTDGSTVHDFFAFHGAIRTQTYAHRHRYELVDVEGSDEQFAVALPSMHEIIPPGYSDLFCEATRAKTTEEAVQRFMYLQWLGVSLLAIQKGEPVPHAQRKQESIIIDDVPRRIEYLAYNARPARGADNVVAASSPLRRRRDLVGLLQAEAICDRSLSLLGDVPMDDITRILSHDARARAIGLSWKN